MADLIEREAQAARDVAVDGEAEGSRVDTRDVVMNEEVMEPDGSERIAERLERHAVVARGQLQLFARDLVALDERG